jgi:hypothetical protein
VRPPRPHEVIAEVLRLHDDEVPAAEIAEQLGLRRQGVDDVLRQHGRQPILVRNVDGSDWCADLAAADMLLERLRAAHPGGYENVAARPAPRFRGLPPVLHSITGCSAATAVAAGDSGGVL